MAAQSTSKKRLALAIIDYLNTSLTDGTIASDEAESVEIATNCIAEAFKVDPTDEAAVKDAVGGQNLLAIYSVYEKLKGKSTASTTGASSAAEGKPSTPVTGGATATGTPDTKKKADELKGKGNAAMQQKNYDSAIDYYTQAITLDPLNPIYLSNRAAAYSGSQRHAEAKADAEMATAADPSYTKAWSRLGLANFALGNAKESMEAYKKGIEAEGNGGSEAMKKGYETAKRRVEEEEGPDAASEVDASAARGGPAGGMPDLSSLLGGMGGGGGGMPDFAQMMNNPMMRQMAENIMSNPDALNNLMSNPRIREMASQFGGGGGGGGGAGAGRGGGMPDLSSLMNDPSIAEMAKNFMGGAGGAGRGRGA